MMIIKSLNTLAPEGFDTAEILKKLALASRKMGGRSNHYINIALNQIPSGSNLQGN